MAPKSTTGDSGNNGGEQSSQEDFAKTTSILAGRRLANPPPGEEIVITGMAGKFPDSHNIDHFKYNLYNKVDLISADERRWAHEHPEIPVRGGKIFELEKFDAAFFGIHQFQIRSLDPMCRQVLERSFEAVLDAGFHPSELEGTRTGIYVGACVSETENVALFVNCTENDYALTGCTRSMLANRLSYFLKTKGPSFVTDTACSSSLYSFDQAYRDLREGKCDYALVCGSNLCLHPYVSLQFARLGVLSFDGRCKSFDNNANGYARSEGIVAIFLQKSQSARRIYARVLHAKTNCDGFKEQGITYPSGEIQKVLLEDFYKECQVPPTSLSYMEAHGTGTKVGDPEELQAIDEVFCTGRDRPLLIGSVKSNIGHNEPVSGLCSIVKIVIGMENGYIPPNLNFNTIREGVEGLEKKRMVVVAEKTPWQDNAGLVGINSFGFGGGNAHTLLKWNEKLKVDGGFPKDDLPRLVCTSGRIKGATHAIFDNIISQPLDAEYVSLLQHAFAKFIPGHQYRGFSIVSKQGEISRSEKYHDEAKRPLVYLFGASDKKWASIGHQLFAIPKFAGSIQRIHEIYTKNGLPVNITEIINSYKADNIAHYVIGTVSVQLALCEMLNELGCKPVVSSGYSLGAIPALYSEGAIKFEEAVLSAFYTSLALTEIMEKQEYNRDNIAKSKTAQHLLKYIKQVIEEPNTDSQRKPISEELVEKVLLFKTREDVEKDLPKDGVVLEIGTGVVPKKIIENYEVKSISGEKTVQVNLVQIGEKDAVISLLEGLGSLYENGVDLTLHALYPAVEFPVSRGTPMISHLIKWQHDANWYVMNYKEWVDLFFGYKMMGFTTKDIEWSYLTGHVIDGRNLFPATGYLCIIWNLYASMWKKMMNECKVVFENVRFIRAVNVPKSQGFNLMLTIQKSSGLFEVVEGDVAVVTGRIYSYKDNDEQLGEYPMTSAPSKDRHLPLTDKDVYKELRLRGYNYSGLFRGIKRVEKGATVGYVEWKNNFTAFMDNMLQMKILQEDTRNLYVPTGINRIVIDPRAHLAFVEELGENPVVPVYVNNDIGTIRTDFIEIRGLSASPIPRKKPMGEPVLETYKFVPNVTNLTLEESIRVNLQLALENVMIVKVKVVEVPEENASEEYVYLGPLVLNTLGDLPLMQPEVFIFTDKTIEVSNITVEDKSLKNETNCLLVVVSDLSLKTPEVLEETLGTLRDNGFIISREKLDSDVSFNETIVDVVTVHTTPSERIFMLKKKLSSGKGKTLIEVPKDNTNFDWLSTLQNSAKNPDEEILVYAQNDCKNGILGLVNCIRREPKMDRVKAVFLQDETALAFDATNEEVGKQLDKGLAVNVYKNGQWGTYRHMLLPENPLVDVEHSYAIVGTPGDLSTLKWIEGSLKSTDKLMPGKSLVQIYYASLNFRDVMTASGRISVDVITRDRTKQLCVQGFEFAGRTLTGERVYGMVCSGALASITTADNYMLWPIPDEWSMADAVTIPCVYYTVIMALVATGKIKAGESILIHSGTGGVGQAAINIATFVGCTIFTTVGTAEKREFIKNNFPQIRETHIGNSRDTSFEQMVMYHTKGRGVDLVLNSLAEEKLAASVRCLAKGGRFLEIGKFDLASDNQLALQIFEKGASFNSIMLDLTMLMDPHTKTGFAHMIEKFQRSGALKPLQRTIFKEEELEQAFRYMASGKHMGKVVLKMRNEEQPQSSTPMLFKSHPRYYVDSDKTIIVIGGLGGFGLELADWLVLRNARKLILTSRRGITTGYQSMRIKTWKTYGADVVVSTLDVTNKEDCLALLEKANEIGPVQAIFNLGVVLKDAILENQNEEDFKTSFAPKAYATEYLDELTRKMCPQLRDFVIFSSVSCGRGNAGQTNYGMANSIMERICEQRKKDGFPALAIEWGAVGDVGLVAEMQESNTELVIGGTLQQRISSCLNVMDTFLRQDEPIVSSMVVAEKRGGTGNFDNAIDAIASILGLRDIKTVSPHQTLPELGMDSIMAVEIKQILETEYEIVLTPQEIRSMTFARIQELEKEKDSGDSKKKDSQQQAENAFKMFLTHIGPASEEIALQKFIKMSNSCDEDPDAKTALLIPGIEGYATVFDPLVAKLKMKAVCLQYGFDGKEQTISKLAQILLPNAKLHIGPTKEYNIIAYSYGVLVGLELINLLEQEGYTGKAVFIDGSPDIMKEICRKNLVYESQATFETSILCGVLSLYLPIAVVDAIKIKMIQCSTYEERIQCGIEYVPKEFPYPLDFLVTLTNSFHERVKSVNNYEKTFDKLKTPVKLIRPKIAFVQDFIEDYNLSKFCENFKEVTVVDGNHVTVLDNAETAEQIKEFMDRE